MNRLAVFIRTHPAAFLLWNGVPGRWVVRVSERNVPALGFWRRTVGEYTGDHFGEKEHPGRTHMFRVFTFASRPS